MRGRTLRASLAALAALVCGVAGCRPPSAPSGYVSLTGTVQALRSDVADLTLKLIAAPPSVRAKGATIACITTEDTELYLNDRVESLDVVRPEDAIELVGYFEPENPRGLRFVVTFAFVRRDEPPPPVPLVLDPQTQPDP